MSLVSILSQNSTMFKLFKTKRLNDLLAIPNIYYNKNQMNIINTSLIKIGCSINYQPQSAAATEVNTFSRSFFLISNCYFNFSNTSVPSRYYVFPYFTLLSSFDRTVAIKLLDFVSKRSIVVMSGS